MSWHWNLQPATKMEPNGSLIKCTYAQKNDTISPQHGTKQFMHGLVHGPAALAGHILTQ